LLRAGSGEESRTFFPQSPPDMVPVDHTGHPRGRFHSGAPGDSCSPGFSSSSGPVFFPRQLLANYTAAPPSAPLYPRPLVTRHRGSSGAGEGGRGHIRYGQRVNKVPVQSYRHTHHTPPVGGWAHGMNTNTDLRNTLHTLGGKYAECCVGPHISADQHNTSDTVFVRHKLIE